MRKNRIGGIVALVAALVCAGLAATSCATHAQDPCYNAQSGQVETGSTAAGDPACWTN